MKLFNRIRFSYIIICIIPIVLMGVAVYAYSYYNSKSIEETYDVSDLKLDSVYNPIGLISDIHSGIVGELKETARTEPSKLLDREYLEEIDANLDLQKANLIITVARNVVYNSTGISTDVNREWEHHMPKGGITKVGKSTVHIMTIDFSTTRGPGCIYVITDFNTLAPSFSETFFSFIFGIGVLMIMVGILLIFNLYRSIMRPLAILKDAALNISNGNLDFKIKQGTDDEFGQLNAAFENMRSKLKEQIELNIQYQRDNRELVSSISHDLKTPITSIKGYVEGILDGVAATPEKQERYMRTIYAKANDMEKMIDELFYYSKVECNAIPYEFVAVNVEEYFGDCVDEISLDLENEGIDFRFNNSVSRNVAIIADPEQLKRVVTNIVRNSVKYIGKKEGHISISLFEEPEFIEVAIADNGPGIAAADLTRIFERFYRTDSSRNSSKGGSGLGLAICKKIVEDHGGKIWATSQINQGTTMHFVLRKYMEGNFNE